MKTVTVYHYDAFSNIPGGGNPAGVVLNGEDLNAEQMQEVAKRVGFNESAFPLQSDKADLRIRYFTPGHEINLCGHATIASIYAMKTRGLLADNSNLTIETNAGILPISLGSDLNGELRITMEQADPQFQVFGGSMQQLAHAIGIEVGDIETKFPVLYGSTGIWTLVVPVKGLDACKRMKPHNALFPSILKEMPRASVHPFCLETYDNSAQLHARHFSSPFSGTVEDPVTGTASGVLGAYYAEYINNSSSMQLNLTVEQGQEIGKDGRVNVAVTKSNDKYEVAITGSAVYVEKFEVDL